MKKKFIYTLSDPNNGLVKYIGKTNNVKNRFQKRLVFVRNLFLIGVKRINLMEHQI